jgi:arylsulfatase A-like enzyme
MNTRNNSESFSGLVQHPNSGAEPGLIFAEYHLGRESEKYMVHDGDLKYTCWVHDIDELYDLRNDPSETHNLAADPSHKKTVERLKQQLLAWRQLP